MSYRLCDRVGIHMYIPSVLGGLVSLSISLSVYILTRLLHDIRLVY
jgi:hypothetical protein